MKRREFITLLGGAAAAWPLVARAQQPAIPVVGFLGSESPSQFEEGLRAFRRGLNESGYIEGRNVVTEFRWAENRNDQLPALAADLVRRQVNVIVTRGILAAQAAKAATTKIPIVFQGGFDPVATGFTASLNRPGGNLTGVTSLNAEVAPKRLELLHELVPTANIIALLVNPTNRVATENTVRDLEAAARTLGLELIIVHASSERDLDNAFATLHQARVGGLVIGTDTLFTSLSERLGTLAVRHVVPTIYQYREFAAAGGLMSYGGSLSDANRQVGVYTARILKGEMPADLPVQQATKVELIINMKTAKALGLTFPLTLLGRADEVIE
jgi:putative ABC transport system substrate-binding protein